MLGERSLTEDWPKRYATGKLWTSSWGTPMPSELLHAAGLESGYNRVQILWGAGVSVYEGETVILLGANGSGKTSAR